MSGQNIPKIMFKERSYNVFKIIECNGPLTLL